MLVDSLKALDPNRPIREADMTRTGCHFRVLPWQTLGLHSAMSVDDRTDADALAHFIDLAVIK